MRLIYCIVSGCLSIVYLLTGISTLTDHSEKNSVLYGMVLLLTAIVLMVPSLLTLRRHLRIKKLRQRRYKEYSEPAEEKEREPIFGELTKPVRKIGIVTAVFLLCIIFAIATESVNNTVSTDIEDEPDFIETSDTREVTEETTEKEEGEPEEEEPEEEELEEEEEKEEEKEEEDEPKEKEPKKEEPSEDSRPFDLATRNAYEAALNYIDTMPFSRSGLIKQLSSEYGSGFTEEQAEAAVNQLEEDNLVDWNAEAIEAAKSYLDTMAFSRQGLINQLTSEYGSGFTEEQAIYAVDQVGL